MLRLGDFSWGLGRFPTTGLYAGLYEFFELITQFNPLPTVPTTGRSTPLG